MKQKMLTVIFVFAAIMIVNPAYSYECIAVGNDVSLNTCAEYQGVNYGFTLNSQRR